MEMFDLMMSTTKEVVGKDLNMVTFQKELSNTHFLVRTYGSLQEWVDEDKASEEINPQIFQKLSGVEKVISGYSGGTTENPTYKEVVYGKTGHFEVVEIIYDKEIISYTLGQESCSPMPYKNQTSILYKGEVSVNAGEFSFSFVVPKDIDNNFANGKISYYAQNSFYEDASGYDDSFVIGGVAENIAYDYDSPVISLFINNRNFIDGGITNSNPLLIVDVEDISGINTVGNGIGHDITAILNNNSTNPFILNEYYKSDLDNFTKGTVEFPFNNLSNGEHSVTFKIWDVFNNSSEKTINFLVTDDGIATISDFLNYPNPFSNGTDFYFQNNQAGQVMDINIQIYTVTGRLVKTIN